MRVLTVFTANIFAFSVICNFSTDFSIISFISVPFLSWASPSISNSNSVACNEFFFTSTKSIFFTLMPLHNDSALRIPSMIFDLFAPKFTRPQSNISPETPATCASITNTIKLNSLKCL